jgi:hypothetical protein
MLPKIGSGAEDMGSAENGSVGLVCVPSAIPARERAQHFVLAQELLIKQAAEPIFQMATLFDLRRTNSSS